MSWMAAKVPRLVGESEPAGAHVSALEALVFARVDGVASVSDIAASVRLEGAMLLDEAADLDVAGVERILEKLAHRGLVEWGPVTPMRAPSSPPPRAASVPPSRPPSVPPDAGLHRSSSPIEERVRLPELVGPPGSLAPPPLPREHSGALSVSSVAGLRRDLDFLEPSNTTSAQEVGRSSRLPPPLRPTEPPPSATKPTEPPPSAMRPTEPPPSATNASEQNPQPERSAASRPPPSRPLPSRPPPSPPLQAQPSKEPAVARVPSHASPQRPPPPPPPRGAGSPSAAGALTLGELTPEDAGDELDPERREKVDALFPRLHELDHYEVLGVPRSATRDELRAAYFGLSKVFHPDTMFRKRLGAYAPKMEAVFGRLTEAYETLGKKGAREEYDRYLALRSQSRVLEEVLARRLDHPAGGSARGPSEVTPRPVEPAPSSAASGIRESSEVARARARELLAKKLRHAARVSSAQSQAATETPHPISSASAELDATPARSGRAEILRGLVSSLVHTAEQTGGVEPSQRHFMNALRAERDGNLPEASRELRVALLMAPERPELLAAQARVDGQLAGTLADTYHARAEYEQRQGKWSEAAESWGKVFAGRPRDAAAARQAAECYVKANRDLHLARELAQRAVELQPKDVACLAVLAQVYLAAGLLLNARRVLQQAAALDPRDQIVETLLKQLKAAE
jgi:curved DNA-binding protein CbpA